MLAFPIVSTSAYAAKDPILTESEHRLVALIMKECGYFTKQDSLRIAKTVLFVHRKLKVRDVRFVNNGTGSSHFLYPGRIIFINLADTLRICDVWIGELPHAQQFAERPLYYSLVAVKGFFGTLLHSFFLSKKEKSEVRFFQKMGCKRLKAKAWVSYRRQYNKRGSLEHNAHSERETPIRHWVYHMLHP